MADEKREMKDMPRNKGENEIERVKREGAEAAGVGKEVRQGAGEGAKAPQEYLAENTEKEANRAQAKGAEVKAEAKGKEMAAGKQQETIKPAAGKKDDDYKQDLVPPIVGKTGQAQAQQPKQNGGQAPRR